MARKNLFTSISILFAVTTLVLIWFLLTLFSGIRKDLSSTYAKEATDKALEESLNLFNPVQQNLILLCKWAESGLFNFNNVEDLNAKLIPVLESMDKVNSLTLAGANGYEYFLSKGDNRWNVRNISITKKKQQIFQQFWSLDNHLISENEIYIDYNPVKRPWFIGAVDSVENDDFFISIPYLFASSNKLGITVSRTCSSAKDAGQIDVIGIDLFLSDLIEFVLSLEVSPNGEAFLIDENNEFISVDMDSKSLVESDLISFYGADSSKSILIKTAVQTWRDKDFHLEEPFEFKVGNEVCWSEIRPLGNRKIRIGVAFPESDILGEIHDRQFKFWMVIGLILIVSMLVTFLLIRKYVKRGNEESILGANDQDFINLFQNLISKGESQTLEFKSTMRMNLNTEKFGKEIEIAWLKGVAAFMNGTGGTVIIGVDDDAKIIGTEADQFANDDKCRLHYKNLIGQHIGAEFSRFLKFGIRAIENNKILIIECKPSEIPVYLKTKNDEAFYIRSGPSSTRLSVSQTVKYLSSRK